ncbi:MAG: pilus assembly protein N-terminal domain-containing protein [Parvibaculum sp.]
MRANRTPRNTARRVFAAALGAGCAALLVGTAQAADFQVEMNKSKPLHLTQPAATVMVGNPAIADVAVEGSQLVYVMGRSYGRTNIIALDGEGKTILDMNVNVVSQNASTVTLMRGTGQLSYNCTPRCERVPSIGDDADAFTALISQSGSLNQANAQAAAMSAAASSGEN